MEPEGETQASGGRECLVLRLLRTWCILGLREGLQGEGPVALRGRQKPPEKLSAGLTWSWP